MFKNIISPVQAWLLSRGQCVGCGMPLSKGTTGKAKNGDITVTCKCGRIFIQDSKTKTYRRALLSEV
jgi:predicted  nucleic acid-binding Zn-ribbon protein